MLVVNKKFVIKDASFVPNGDPEYFIVNLYRLMIESGAIVDHSVPADAYSIVMYSFKQPYKASGGILHNEMKYIDDNTYEWAGLFESAAVYEDYKKGLLGLFNTDFNSSIDNDSLTIEVSQTEFN